MIKRGSISLKFIVTGILVLLVALCMSAGLLLVSDKALAEGGTEAELIEIKSSNISYSFILTGTGKPNDEVVYTGADNNVPAIRVGYDTKNPELGIIALTENVDYTVSSTDVDAGPAGFTVTGTGKYKGSVVYANSYKIVKAVLTPENLDCTVGQDTVEYTGEKNNLPADVVIKLNGVALQASDYVLSSDNIEEGKADIIVEGKGNCEGTVVLAGRYNIEKVDFSKNTDKIKYTVEGGSAELGYTGRTDNVPEGVKVRYNGAVLGEEDYELTTREDAFGDAPLIVTGKGKYKGSAVFDKAFKVVKENNNEWLEEPSVIGWVYGSFSLSDSLLTALPKAGKATLAIVVAEDNFTKPGKVVQIAGKDNFSFENDGTLSEEVINGLKELPKGQYWLTANVIADAEKYSGVPMTRVPFEVSQLTNYWESSPNIIRWSWGEFDSAVNTITAKPKYMLEGQTVKFTVFDKDYLNPVNEALTAFTVSSNVSGSVEDRNVINALNALDAGTYYLEASYYEQDNNNILPLKTPIQFTVFKVSNHWETTPNIVQWKWGEFDKDVNVISAVPSSGNREDVVFGVYKDKQCNDRVSELLASFSFEKIREEIKDAQGNVIRYEVKYILSDEVTAEIENLDAGTYYLRAVLEETLNYTGLGTAKSIEFKVQNVQNHWAETPSVLSWKYGEYDRTFNKISARPALGDKTVIAIYDADGDAVMFADGANVVTGFSLADGLVPEYVANKLKTLDVGKYYMLASVEGTVNYTGLNNYTGKDDIKEHAIGFEVTTSVNGWAEIPKILSWGEGRFDREVNGVTASAVNGNDKMLIRVYDAEGNIVATNNGSGELDYEALSKLGVGSYRVTFEIEGTNNYTKLTGETTFAVFEDSVGLTGIIVAAIVFGVFDIAAATVCVLLIVRRRKKIEQNFREMVKRELGRR